MGLGLSGSFLWWQKWQVFYRLQKLQFSFLWYRIYRISLLVTEKSNVTDNVTYNVTEYVNGLLFFIVFGLYGFIRQQVAPICSYLPILATLMLFNDFLYVKYI